MKKSQEIFHRHGGKPIEIKAQDSRFLINGYAPKVACRLVAEQLYQDLISEVDQKRNCEDAHLLKGVLSKVDCEITSPDRVRLLTFNPSHVGHAIRVKDEGDNGHTWYGVVDADGLALMTRIDLLPKSVEGE
jgi:hypothetical protein